MSKNTNDKKEKEKPTTNQDEEQNTNYTASYIALVNTYTAQFANNADSKKNLKNRFFNVMCTIIFFMIFSFIGTLIFTFVLLFTKNISPSIISGIIPVIISSFVTMLTAILKLPQIIANYLFNKDEDNQMVEIIKSIQQYEVDISKSQFIYQKFSHINHDRPFHGIRFHVIMSLAPKSRGKYLSYQWIISYKNSFYVGYDTIRVVERPRKIK